MRFTRQALLAPMYPEHAPEVQTQPSLAPQTNLTPSGLGFPRRSFAEANETPPSHIPAFLPALPDAHTYKQTETFSGKPHKEAEAKLKQYADHRHADKVSERQSQRRGGDGE